MRFFQTRKWKQGVLFIVVCMLFGVLYFVWTFDGEMPSWPFVMTYVPEEDEAVEMETSWTSVVTADTRSGTTFDTYRITRMQGTSKRIETIRETLQHIDMSPQARDQMTQALFDMVEQGAKEREVETWLIARGMSDALVFSDEDVVEVMLPDRLSLEEINGIGEFVSRTMGIPLEQITIVDGIVIY